MSERAGDRRPRARRIGPATVAWAAASLFLIVLALLATRVAAGEDPALRARAAAAPLPPRRVLVRKIYERRVIIHLPASAPPQPAQSSQQVSSSGGYAGGGLVTRTS
ncbi:MAG TPA: hypothetical protein VN772_05180 [Solirubrobacteraceae bacterium]|nr:hypothetical protein [Solirubrobacteraceae bacterium]